MSKTIKVILIISAVIIVLVVLSVVFWPKQNQPSNTNQPVTVEPNDNQPATTTEPEIISKDKDLDISKWVAFNSVQDAGIKFDFTFEHPASWFHRGSIDGGDASAIPFFRQGEYIQDCKSDGPGVYHCQERGGVAAFQISGESIIFPENQKYYEDEKIADIVIDGYKGKKIIGTVDEKSYWEMIPMGEIGEKEVRVIIKGINNHLNNNKKDNFDFSMPLRDEIDEKVFNEIIKTIKFNEK